MGVLYLLYVCMTVLVVHVHTLHSPIHAEPRIVNGVPTTYDEYPFLAGIRMFLYDASGVASWSDTFCGATLIRKEYPAAFLTASHCLYENTDELVLHIYTTHRLEYPVYGVNGWYVWHYILHEDFDKETLGDDVAIVFIDADLTQYSDISVVSLPNLPVGTECCTVDETLEIIGYGRVAWDGDFSETLEYLDVAYMSLTQCNLDFCRFETGRSSCAWSYVNGNNICAASPDAASTPCFGDSGGPLMKKGSLVQVGLVSWGIGCWEHLPTVYTSTATYNSWIQTQLDTHVGTDIEWPIYPWSPTSAPTLNPTVPPTTSSPTKAPTTAPTRAPAPVPTNSPTVFPTQESPFHRPSQSPTPHPTPSPTPAPVFSPTGFPTIIPTDAPTVSKPTVSQTHAPVNIIPGTPTLAPTSPMVTTTTTTTTSAPTSTTTKVPTTRRPTTPTPTFSPNSGSTPTTFPTRTVATLPTDDPSPQPTLSPIHVLRFPTTTPTLSDGSEEPFLGTIQSTMMTMPLDLSTPAGQDANTLSAFEVTLMVALLTLFVFLVTFFVLSRYRKKCPFSKTHATYDTIKSPAPTNGRKPDMDTEDELGDDFDIEDQETQMLEPMERIPTDTKDTVNGE